MPNSMNPLGGNQPPQPKISLKDTTEVVCDNCNHNVFHMGILLRKISPFLTGTGKPSYLPIDNIAFYCVKCGSVNKEFIPTELQQGNIIT